MPRSKTSSQSNLTKDSNLLAQDRVATLNSKARELMAKEPQKALNVLYEARDLALKIGFENGLGDSLLNLARLHVLNNAFEQAFTEALKAKEIFERQKNFIPLLDSLLLLGKICKDTDKIEDSSVFFDNGISISQKIGNTLYEADFLNNRAINSSVNGNYIDAIKKYKIVIKLNEENNDLLGQAKSYINLGADLTNIGNYQEGLNNLFKAYKIIEENLNDFKVKSMCLINIGNTYQDMGNSDISAEYYDKALKISQENKDKYMETMCLNNLGESYFLSKKFQLALNTFEMALKKAKKFRIQDLEMYILDGLGKTQNQLENYNQAIEYQQQSLSLAEQTGDLQSKINAFIGFGDAYFGLQDHQKAIDYYQESLQLSSQIKQPKTAYEAHQKLADVYQKIADLPKTIEHLREYHKLEREVLNQETAQKTKNLSLQFDLERARHEAEVYRVQNEAVERANDLLEEKVTERTRELEEARVEIVMRLALAAEYRDDSTGQHTLRVGRTSALLGQALGMPNNEVELLRSAARLHDVGKIGISDIIMLKPSKLTPAEFEVIKTHTIIGKQMLSNGQSPLLKMAELIAVTHHERFDGTGYPNGLVAEDIPLVGRIVAVADVYDALRSERPYKRAWSQAEARAEITVQAGKHFDAQVVKAFLKILDSGEDLG